MSEEWGCTAQPYETACNKYITTDWLFISIYIYIYILREKGESDNS